MIIDTIENLPLYHILGKKEEKWIQDFCKNAEEENTKEGRTDFSGEDLYALIQVYETKSIGDTVMEAHSKYLDLQYIVEGEEYFYIHRTSKCNVKEDQTPEKDFIFLECNEPEVKVKAEKGMFVLLFPQDAHMPCIQTERKKRVKKVVFKINLQGQQKLASCIQL